MDDAMHAQAGLFQAAEELVSWTEKRQLTFTHTQPLTSPDGDQILFRCVVQADKRPAGTLILKKSPVPLAGGLEMSEKAEGFIHDWVGVEFLTILDPLDPLGPHFLGGDPRLGFYLMEDLGEHRSLVEPLLQGSPAEARLGLLKYAVAMGRLHARTAGQASRFSGLFSERFPSRQPFAEELDGLNGRFATVQRLLSALNVPADSRLGGELQAVASAAAHPGPFLAYLHGDPCPDNLFDRGDRYRWIDFEWGHFGHALLDAVYPRMCWPSCWCAGRLPAAILTEMESAYRRELAPVCPPAQDDSTWLTAQNHLCALTLLNRLGWDLETALDYDRPRGRATVRQRTLAQLEAFIGVTEGFNRLPALRAAAGGLLERLQQRWADTPAMPLFPAFERPAG